jgi:hypothetical protein
MKVNKEFDANGKEGFLLIYPDFTTAEPDGERMVGGKIRKMVKCKDTIVAFRVYEYDEHGKHKRDEEGGTIFTDYRIRHCDLKIKLLDGHFYETDKGDFLDYPDMRCYDVSKTSDSDTPRPEDAEG